MLLGRGRAAACTLYETGWTKLCWLEAPIKEGTVVGTLGRHFGSWALNACRIAYVIEEEEPLLQRYGFALPAHVERGEERFTVEWHCADDSVFYEVFSFCRRWREPIKLVVCSMADLPQDPKG